MEECFFFIMEEPFLYNGGTFQSVGANYSRIRLAAFQNRALCFLRSVLGRKFIKWHPPVIVFVQNGLLQVLPNGLLQCLFCYKMASFSGYFLTKWPPSVVIFLHNYFLTKWPPSVVIFLQNGFLQWLFS